MNTATTTAAILSALGYSAHHRTQLLNVPALQSVGALQIDAIVRELIEGGIVENVAGERDPKYVLTASKVRLSELACDTCGRTTFYCSGH